MRVTNDYPDLPAARRRWIEGQRGPKNTLDPCRPYAFLWEEEAGPTVGSAPLSTVTVFLTNHECPYRCLICDLWRNTLDRRVPEGAIAEQIRYALERLPQARQIKLYNAGSFFDPQAIPPGDYGEIAQAVEGFERVIVECHPKLVGERCRRFQNLLGCALEVAIGLETVHPLALERLNKRFTVEDFECAAQFLRDHNMALRVFLLVRPPFLTEAEGISWAKQSLNAAFDAGAATCCVIPTRGGNGAMESLAADGLWAPPSLASLEAVQEYGLELGHGRVFADLWDIAAFASCECSPARVVRMEAMNRTQQVTPPIQCVHCDRKTL